VSVFLPGQHNLWRSIVSRGNITSHLVVLFSSQSKVANLQVTIVVD
jgi:hypothetical protein